MLSLDQNKLRETATLQYFTNCTVAQFMLNVMCFSLSFSGVTCLVYKYISHDIALQAFVLQHAFCNIGGKFAADAHLLERENCYHLNYCIKKVSVQY